MKKIAVLAVLFAVVACGGMGWWTYNQTTARNKSDLMVILYESENRLLKDQCHELEYKLTEANGKPTFEDGQRDAIIRMGGPSSPGSYRDGYEAAMKVLGKNDYAEGYHAAISQFGYKSDLYLVAKPGTTTRYSDSVNVTGGTAPEKKDEKK